jgi:phenylacetate-CoA ligase
MRALGLRRIICAGEPGAGLPEVRARIEEATGAVVHDALGGAHGIMNASDGAHPYDGMTVLADDCSVQQLVDPASGAAVAIPDDGRPAYGERVKTTLRWRAQPQLRGAVGDVYEMRRVPGASGALETRVRVIGRTDDLLIVKGVKIYPAAVRDLVAELARRLVLPRHYGCASSALKGSTQVVTRRWRASSLSRCTSGCPCVRSLT